MNQKSLWQMAISLLLGFSIAWLVKPAQSEQNRADDTDSIKRNVARERRPDKARDYRLALSKLRDEDGGSEYVREFTQKLSNDELVDFLEALSKSAGFDGLSEKDLNLLNEILDSWYENDPKAVLKWIRSLDNLEDQKNIMSHLMESMAARDMEQCFELADYFSRNYGGVFPVSMLLMQRAANHGADAVVRLCKYTVSDYSGHSGYGLTYPDDFDFESAIEGLTRLSREAPKGYRPTTEPFDLLETWASRDSDAAWKWLQKIELQGDISKFGEFCKGYRKTVNDQQFADFLFENHNRFKVETNGEHIQSFWNEVPLSLGVVETYIGRLSEEEIDQHAVQILHAASNGWGETNLMIQEAVFRKMSEEGLRGYFMSRAKDEAYKESDFENLRIILKRIGHAESEIDAMLSVKKAEKE